jgi:hypothetical protein
MVRGGLGSCGGGGGELNCGGAEGEWISRVDRGI